MVKTTLKSGLLSLVAVAALSSNALAHHPTGGMMPATLGEGLLSGLGHPIIGLDHLAALIAVGCIAARQANGPLSAFGYVAAMILGAALHVRSLALPLAEVWVALSVIVLGALLLRDRAVSAGMTLALFAVTGLVHGYALGESIVGAESTPLTAYFAGLIVIQSAIVLGIMLLARKFGHEGFQVPVRVAGGAVAAVGVVVLALQFVQGA
jgi:urease accessory protein